MFDDLMTELLELACTAQGFTKPNPMVAAAVVKDGVVVARGLHRRCGEAHAEADVLAQVGDAAKGATLVVTLEPCTHQGKTPPCCEAIIDAGIARVVYAVDDPADHVRRQPARAVLEAAGIEVVSGVMADAAAKLNRVFFHNCQSDRPYVTVKVAQSLDGKIALENGVSQYITRPEALERVHHLRGGVDAVMVGGETVRLDDPRLDVRLHEHGYSQPAKVIVSRTSDVPCDARVFEGPAPVMCLTQHVVADRWGGRLSQIGSSDLVAGLKALKQRGIGHVLLEGGGQLITAAFESGVVDEVMCFIAPKIFGGQQDRGWVGRENSVLTLDDVVTLREVEVEKLGTDVLVWGLV